MTTDEDDVEMVDDQTEADDEVLVDRDGDELPFDPAEYGGLEEDGGVIEKYDMSGCEVTSRRGKKTTPYVGQSIWLLPFSPSGATYAGIGVAGSADKEDLPGMSQQFDRMCKALSEVVIGHNLVKMPGFGDREPVLYPDLYQNPDAVRELPDQAVFYIWTTVIKGETPKAPRTGRNVSVGGRSTRTNSRSTARSGGARRPARR